MTQKSAAVGHTTPTVAMTAEQRASFDRDGYLIIRSALSPSRMCGSLKDSAHDCPRWVAPIKHHPESRTNEGTNP